MLLWQGNSTYDTEADKRRLRNIRHAMDAFTKVQPAYVKAREYCRLLAEKWAEQMKDEK